MALALGGGFPRVPRGGGALSQPSCPPAAPCLSNLEGSAPALQEELLTRPPGGECLGLTQMGNESPGQPLHGAQPPLRPSPPARLQSAGPHRPSGPLWAPAGPVPFLGLPVHQLGNSGCSSAGQPAPVGSRGSQQHRRTLRLRAWPCPPLTCRAQGPSDPLWLPPRRRPLSYLQLLVPAAPRHGLPLAPQGPGPDSVPFTWFCPLPSPLPAPPQSSQ